jgi:hypothetical protein
MQRPWSSRAQERVGYRAEQAAKEALAAVRSVPLGARKKRLLALAQKQHASEQLSSLNRVVAISDVHTDHNQKNWDWITSLPTQPETLCIVAGDVCDTIAGLAHTFEAMRPKFGALAFVPGNHDLWCKSAAAKAELEATATSFDKLLATLELCERLGVCHGPALLDGVAVVPLFGWYVRGANGSAERSLFVNKEGEDAEMTHEAWSDNYMCNWP